MIKRLIISVLCIAILCTLFVGSALAAVNGYNTLGGIACRGQLSWSGKYAYATSNFGESGDGKYADSLTTTATTYYLINGVTFSVSKSNPAVNSKGNAVTAKYTESATTVKGTSKHVFVNNGASETINLSTVYQ